tara:strand:- start:44516 stop:45682 length:1167 start_codon:yes stop_codon:yes gene_type:complete
MINYGRQFLDKKDILSVSNILKSNWLTQGPIVKKFETALKKKFGANYCCVVSNGTAALHLAGLSLGWKKGDIVIASSLSFLASSNSIIYTGATPSFVDINPTTYTIDVRQVEKKLKIFANRNKKVVAIIATDYAGHPCDWKKLKLISKKYNVKLINDNCHAIGASYKNDSKYALKFADVVTHSYHPVKNITTGEGGSILTNNKAIDKKVRSLRSHGITRNVKEMKKYDGPWYYEMNDLGFNYRITDFQCALGLSQLKKLNKFVKKRKEIAKIYDLQFKNSNFYTIPHTSKDSSHSYHLYPLKINFSNKDQKKRLFQKLKNKKINVQVHYIPIHLQPYYKKRYNFKKGDCPITEEFYTKELSLPIFYSLKKKDIYKVIRVIKEFCEKNL